MSWPRRCVSAITSIATIFPLVIVNVMTVMRRMHSGEGLSGGGNDLIVWHIAYVLSDVPAMPERVLELAVTGAPRTCPRAGTHPISGNSSATCSRPSPIRDPVL